MVSKSTVVATACFESPLGPLCLSATGLGLSRIEFHARRAPADARGAGGSAFLDEAIDELRAFFAGRPRPTQVVLDLSCGSPFQRKVWRTLATTLPAELLTYGELAARVGSPGAARAIGSAMARNPVPILVPCHRVIAANGRPGGYGHGLPTKSRLLSYEGCALPGFPPSPRAADLPMQTAAR